MKKNKLKALSIPCLPKNREDAIYRTQSVQYILRSRLSPDKKILIVTFFDRESIQNGFSLPTGILYLSRTDYTTRVTFDGKSYWSNSRISYALKQDYKKECVCLTPEDERRIKVFLWDSDLPVPYYVSKESLKRINSRIERCQESILEDKNIARKKICAESVDKRMKIVPSLPKSFNNWIDRWPLLKSRYIYYRRQTPKSANCYCTNCQKDFVIKEKLHLLLPKHNDSGICPECKSKIKYKAIGKSTKIYDSSYAAILQRTRQGEFLMRYFYVSRLFGRDYINPQTEYHENGRLLFNTAGEITGQYKHGWSGATGRYGWYETRDTIVGESKKIDFEINLGMYIKDWNVWFRPCYFYHQNLRAMLKRLNLSYDIPAIVKGKEVDATSYILRSMKYPFASSLSKIGMAKLSKDLLTEYFELTGNLAAKPLHAKLGVQKDFLALLKKENWGMKAVNLMATLKKHPTESEFLWMYQEGMSAEKINFLRNHTTYHKIQKYISRQVKINKKGNYYSETAAGNIASTWKDYLEMCKKIGYDTDLNEVIFPRNIKDEHDKIQQLIRVKFDPVTDKKIMDIYPSLNREYSYLGEKYLLCPPKDFNDFIIEGANLLHCVCTNEYYRDHVKGTRLIFFVRKVKKPETPFFTLEYDVAENRIWQLQGFRHKTAPQEVREFVDSWKNLKRSAQTRKVA